MPQPPTPQRGAGPHRQVQALGGSARPDLRVRLRSAQPHRDDTRADFSSVGLAGYGDQHSRVGAERSGRIVGLCNQGSGERRALGDAVNGDDPHGLRLLRFDQGDGHCRQRAEARVSRGRPGHSSMPPPRCVARRRVKPQPSQPYVAQRKSRRQLRRQGRRRGHFGGSTLNRSGLSHVRPARRPSPRLSVEAGSPAAARWRRRGARR